MSGKLSVVRPLLLPARIAGLMRLGVKITVVRPLLFKQPKKYYGHDPSSCAGFRLFYGCEAHWMAIYEFTQWLLRTAVAVTNREIIRGASPVIQTNNCTTPEVARIKMQTHSTGAGFQPVA